MTTPISATILTFPLERARPGLRQHLTRVAQMIRDAKAQGAWQQKTCKVSPDFVLGIIPSEAALATTSVPRMADCAIKVSLLSLHAIHAGDWAAREAIPALMDLQVAATRFHDIAARKAS